jgi:hypothetical protein
MKFKRILSFFFLFLFLFPTVEKQLHAFEHHNDQHCTATDKHFHSVEHSCSICDFTGTDSNTSPDVEFQFVLSFIHFKHQQFVEDTFVPAAFNDLPSRAPPVV